MAVFFRHSLYIGAIDYSQLDRYVYLYVHGQANVITRAYHDQKSQYFWVL